jgi:Cu/Ag efflux protein CusF
VVDHEEIPGFMAPMVMNYLVTPPTLLQGLRAGERIRFTIDEDQRAIVDITPREK